MKKESNKGFKKLVLLLLLFVGLGASVTAGAYWASSVAVTNAAPKDTSLVVTVGKGQAVTATYALDLGTPQNSMKKGSYSGSTFTEAEPQTAVTNLVPTSRVVDNTAANYNAVQFTVEVLWGVGFSTTGITNNDVVTTSTFTSTLNSALIGDTEYSVQLATGTAQLFNVIITPASNNIEVGTSVPVTVTIVFANEPADKDMYDLVATKLLTVSLSFEVAAV